MPHKGDDNLKRGNIAPKYALEVQAHGGALKRTSGAENLQAARDNDARIARAVKANPDAALEEIHASLTILASGLLKRSARQRATVPERAVMDVVKEFRQTQEAVNEARKARGAVAEVEDFFATLDSRLEEATTRLEASLRPAVAVPS